MKMVKSLVLGSAAALLAAAGAQAADLPVKAKAVEYVRICSLYGAGFFYIPGTDTCIKLGGYLRVDTTFNGGNYDTPNWNGNGGLENRYKDYFQSRSRMALTIDTRTATEYGVVRTFGQADFSFSDPDGTAQYAGPPAGSQIGAEMLFIQFAGFTFGKSASAFSSPWHTLPGNYTIGLLGAYDTVTGVNNIQYTANFGNGVSATIGLDSPMFYDRSAVYNTTFVGVNALGTSGNAYANVHAPDIVGNIKVDQAWGLFQLSAAAHEVSGSYNILTPATAAPTTLSEISGHPDSKWGGAVQGALQIKNIPTGPGDDVKMSAVASWGNTKRVIDSPAGSPNFAMISGSNVAYQSIGLGATTDAVYSPGLAGNDGQLKLTKAWGFQGGFNHNWDPYWSTSVFGSYSSVRFDGSALDTSTAMGAYCAAFAVTHPGQNVTYTCNPNYNVAQAGIVTRWTPVRNLTFSAEVMWTHLDQNMGNGPGLVTSTSVFSPGAPKPVTAYEFRDQDKINGMVRVQRNF